MPSWKDVAFALISCFAKCRCHIHSKCGKSCCDCDIDPVITPQPSSQDFNTIAHKSPATKRKRLPITPISV